MRINAHQCLTSSNRITSVERPLVTYDRITNIEQGKFAYGLIIVKIIIIMEINKLIKKSDV